MSDNEYDDILDDFADFVDVDWGTLLAGPPTDVQPNFSAQSGASETPLDIPNPPAIPAIPPQPHSPASSLYFDGEDDMDSAFLAELDRVERNAIEAPQVAESSSMAAGAGTHHHHRHHEITAAQTAARGDEPTATSAEVSDRRPGALAAPQPQSHRISDAVGSHYFPNRTVQISSPQKLKDIKIDGTHASSVPSKRPRLDDSLPFTSPKRKGKMKADNQLAQIVSGYEDELMCPICCDIFVASHVGNPCGHTFCGECGWQWHANGQNEKKSCPCCRQTLDKNMPMIPNISIDNTVEKHVKALALSGVQEWEPGGSKYQEWNARKRAWRNGAEKRAKKKARQPTKVAAQPYIPLDAIQVFDAPAFWFRLEDNVEEDPTYEDSDEELIPRPIRRARRAR